MFSEESLTYLEQIIVDSELQTSAEIRIRLENYCPKDVMSRALEVFEELDMHKTQLQNGVLFYLSIEDKRFSILGDKGIHQLVHQVFWDEIRDNALRFFKIDKYTEGLEFAIKQVLNQAIKHFPYQKGDINELPNEISVYKH